MGGTVVVVARTWNATSRDKNINKATTRLPLSYDLLKCRPPPCSSTPSLGKQFHSQSTISPIASATMPAVSASTPQKTRRCSPSPMRNAVSSSSPMLAWKESTSPEANHSSKPDFWVKSSNTAKSSFALNRLALSATAPKSPRNGSTNMVHISTSWVYPVIRSTTTPT